MRKTSITLLLFIAATSLWAAGEARVTGKVLDAEGNPVEGATISVEALERKNVERSVTSGEDGSYAMFLADGTLRYKVTVRKDGYAPYTDEWKLQLLPTRNEIDITLASASAPNVVADTTNPAYEIFNEGVKLANDGDAEAAIEKFREAVEVDETLGAGWKALARLYARTSDWEMVAETGEKAIEIDGQDEVINSLLADAYTMLGDKEKAAEYQQLAPANPAVLYNQAVPFLNDNNDTEAEKLLRKAVQVDDTFAKAHYELGSLYARQSKNDLAQKHLLRFLELEPEGENAAFARELLKYLN